MILPVGHDQIQDGCQIDPHGTLFRHFNIYNFLLDNICFQKKLVSLNIPGGAREAPYSTRLTQMLENEGSSSTVIRREPILFLCEPCFL